MIRGGRDAYFFAPPAYPSRMDFCARYGPWALVTGASSGIGAEFARALAQRGVHVALAARRLERLDELAAELRRETGVEARAVRADLTDADGAARLAAAVADLDLGLLVNNAGFGWQGPFRRQEPEAIARMVRLNCEAPALLARAILPRLVARGRGGMIVVASMAGFQPTPWVSLYGATKSFDLMLGAALAAEMRGTGVDVLSIAPGHTRSEFHAVAGVRGPALGTPAEPGALARAALAQLGRRAVYVPGWRHRCVLGVQRLLPRSWVAAASGRLLRRRMERGALDAQE